MSNKYHSHKQITTFLTTPVITNTFGSIFFLQPIDQQYDNFYLNGNPAKFEESKENNEKERFANLDYSSDSDALEINVEFKKLETEETRLEKEICLDSANGFYSTANASPNKGFGNRNIIDPMCQTASPSSGFFSINNCLKTPMSISSKRAKFNPIKAKITENLTENWQEKINCEKYKTFIKFALLLNNNDKYFKLSVLKRTKAELDLISNIKINKPNLGMVNNQTKVF